MKALVTGAAGQLGTDLMGTAPPGIEVSGFSKDRLDICSSEAVMRQLIEQQPDVVINTAAYTQVDKAETDADRAYAVNAQAVGYLAVACHKLHIRLIHLSTDYVFDGQKNTPYTSDDMTGPRSVYGASKLAGEEELLSVGGLHANIVRVSWLYGLHGANFVHTMLRLMNERRELGIVVDQIGTPTFTGTLAEALWSLAQRPDLQGIWHWSDLGVTSWYDFSKAIYQIARPLGLIKNDVAIKPITTADYPTPAARPAYSVLDSSTLRGALSLPGVYWRDNLSQMLKDVAHV